MGWKDLTFTVRDSLLAQKIAGIPVELLAEKVGIRPTTLDRRLREWAQVNDLGQLRKPQKALTRWDTPPRFKGDAVVAGDLHLPYLDYDFAGIMLDTAMVLLPKPRRLIIAGDLFNMDVFSRYIATNPYTPSFREELEVTVKFLEDALGVFDYIEVLLGNHELRFVYRLLGEVGNEELGKLIGVDNVNFYEYSHCILDTINGDWRITHQASYSVNSQSVGKKLAHKFRQHIITHHQHKVSKGFDDSGQSVIIDNGCLADPGVIPYANQTDSTAPVMTQSFVVVRDGVGNLFANDPSFTDYTFLE